MGERKTTSEQVRKKIEDAILVAAEDRKRKLLSQRITLAKSGVQAFQKHDMGTAIKSFVTYLRILEDVKGVDHGGLTPQHFDMRLDRNELIMISGVYWDLCKIYDRVKVENKEFQQFMRKYIQFTKGMPFQAVCAETLRKYIANGKPKHPNEFKAAYKILAVSRCFVVTSLLDVIDEPALPTLRRFRDEFLARQPWGRGFIRWYYRNGPQIAQQVDALHPALRRGLGKIVSSLAKITKLFLTNESAHSAGSEGDLEFVPAWQNGVPLVKVDPERKENDHSAAFNISSGDIPPGSTVV